MVIQKPAIAGTLESSDCMVTVEPGEGKIDLDLKGALDCTIKARVECAVYRSNGVKDQLPWGGAIV